MGDIRKLPQAPRIVPERRDFQDEFMPSDAPVWPIALLIVCVVLLVSAFALFVG